MADKDIRQRIRRVVDLGKQIYIFTTVDEENRPRSRYMGTLDITDDYAVFYLATQQSSRKVKQIGANPNAQLLFVTPDYLETVTISGKAHLESLEDMKHDMWAKNPMLAGYFSSVEDPEYALIRFESEFAEYINLNETRGVADIVPWLSQPVEQKTEKG